MIFTFWLRKLFSMCVLGILSTIILSNGIVTSTFGLSSNASAIQEQSLSHNKINNLSPNIGLIDKIKDEIKDTVDKNSSKSAIAIGFVDPNGT